MAYDSVRRNNFLEVKISFKFPSKNSKYGEIQILSETSCLLTLPYLRE